MGSGTEPVLSAAEVQDMRALEPSRRNRLLLRLLYSTGLRPSELCGLSWRDVQEGADTGQLIIAHNYREAWAAALGAAEDADLGRAAGLPWTRGGSGADLPQPPGGPFESQAGGSARTDGGQAGTHQAPRVPTAGALCPPTSLEQPTGGQDPRDQQAMP
jgi:hypothetical protein